MRNKSISLSNILSKIISSWHISRSSWKVAYDTIKLQLAQLGPAWPWIPEGPSWGYRVKVSVIAINVMICSRLLIDTISATTFASHGGGKKPTHEKHKHSCFHGWVILDLLYQLGLLFMASDKGVEERECKQEPGWQVFEIFLTLRYWVSGPGFYCQLFPYGE